MDELKQSTVFTVQELSELISKATNCTSSMYPPRFGLPIGVIGNDLGIIMVTTGDNKEKTLAMKILTELLSHNDRCARASAYGFLTVIEEDLPDDIAAQLMTFRGVDENQNICTSLADIIQEMRDHLDQQQPIPAE